jgi:hypothetical protein
MYQSNKRRPLTTFYEFFCSKIFPIKITIKVPLPKKFKDHSERNEEAAKAVYLFLGISPFR